MIIILRNLNIHCERAEACILLNLDPPFKEPVEEQGKKARATNFEF